MKNKKKDNIISFPTSPTKLERQVEAILFAASEPLEIETIEKRLQTSSDISKVIEKIKFLRKVDDTKRFGIVAKESYHRHRLSLKRSI